MNAQPRLPLPHGELHKLRTAMECRLLALATKVFQNRFKICQSVSRLEVCTIAFDHNHRPKGLYKVQVCADSTSDDFFFLVTAGLPQAQHQLPILMQECFAYRASDAGEIGLYDNHSLITTANLALSQLDSAMQIASQFGPAPASVLATCKSELFFQEPRSVTPLAWGAISLTTN
jgi:hypothetical protein